jgi:hypothetical protein
MKRQRSGIDTEFPSNQPKEGQYYQRLIPSPTRQTQVLNEVVRLQELVGTRFPASKGDQPGWNRRKRELSPRVAD